jgi:two-component system chemotaxis sensor kinase CheA
MDEKQEIAGFDEDMREIFDSYLVESKEILDHLTQDLLALEKNPSNTELLNNIFRGVHTLKGTSSFLGFNQMTELTHTGEDLLNKLRKGDIVADSKIIDVLIEVRNAASVLLQRIESRDLQPIELNGLLEKIRGAMQQQPVIAQV